MQCPLLHTNYIKFKAIKIISKYVCIDQNT